MQTILWMLLDRSPLPRLFTCLSLPIRLVTAKMKTNDTSGDLTVLHSVASPELKGSHHEHLRTAAALFPGLIEAYQH